MFLMLVFISLLIYYVFLWGDYIRLLIFLEVIRLWLICIIIEILVVQYINIDYFILCLVFLVSESSLGFILFIFYVRMESEVVKKLSLAQF